MFTQTTTLRIFWNPAPMEDSPEGWVVDFVRDYVRKHLVSSLVTSFPATVKLVDSSGMELEVRTVDTEWLVELIEGVLKDGIKLVENLACLSREDEVCKVYREVKKQLRVNIREKEDVTLVALEWVAGEVGNLEVPIELLRVEIPRSTQ